MRMREMGIGVVVDLRRPSERERQPSRRWEGFAGQVIENNDHDEGAETWDLFMSTWDMTQDSFRGYMDRYYARAPYTPRLVELYRKYLMRSRRPRAGWWCTAQRERIARG
jgi:hypothetical protein